VFGDLRQRALAVYRVQTQASVYIVGVHELRGRKFVIARGEPGTDREHVVARDSDPRVGDASLFELPVEQWPGRSLEVATMVSSPIVSVEVAQDPDAIAAVSVDGQLAKNPWARPEPVRVAPPGGGGDAKLPVPAGLSERPRIVPGRARGTNPAASAVESFAQSGDVAHRVVVGEAAPAAPPAAQAQLPYPQRHVHYAETVASLLRSIARRDRLFEDVDRETRTRLRRALDESVLLLETIRRRDRA